MARKKIEIYDTTLRDGTQGEGVHLSIGDKLDIARALDDIGVDYIEGGWPGSNPKDNELFARICDLDLKTSKVCAFGSTRRADSSPADDFFLQKLVAAKADVTTIFGKSWDLHVEEALRVSLDKNLDMIAESIAYLVEATGKPVFYDAEHFFDGFRNDPGYALATIRAAVDAGASRIVLCDTNGGMMPQDVSQAVREAQKEIPGVRLGIHVHNDGGLGVANSLRAVEDGVIQVQGTINGIGERCGNADLTAVIANLELKLGYRCLPDGKIHDLTHLSRQVWEHLGMSGPPGQPYVGPSAFSHKGGVHASAMQRNALTYEHIDPDEVGNSRKILISELAGGSNLRAKHSGKYPELGDADTVRAILEEVQDREHVGYSYEKADGSFDLIIRRHTGRYKTEFEPIYYRIYSPSNEEHTDSDGLVEASVKLRVGDELMLCAAEGNGPVDAINHALQKALTKQFPAVQDLHLRDYSVRVINSTKETAAKVRVYIEHSFEGEAFGTVGVNVDIIKASWNALVEAYHYALMKHVEFAGSERDSVPVQSPDDVGKHNTP